MSFVTVLPFESLDSARIIIWRGLKTIYFLIQLLKVKIHICDSLLQWRSFLFVKLDIHQLFLDPSVNPINLHMALNHLLCQNFSIGLDDFLDFSDLLRVH